MMSDPGTSLSLRDRLRDPKAFPAPAPLSLREVVARDLVTLLSGVHLEAVADLDRLPEVQTSVLNFGVPDMTGHPVSDRSPMALRKALLRSLRQYEPRIDGETLSLEILPAAEQPHDHALHVVLSVRLVAAPDELPLMLALRVDPETGRIDVMTEGDA